MIPSIGIYRNEFGISFRQVLASHDGGYHHFYQYICQECGHQLSKNGAKEHKCQSFIQKQLTQISEEKHCLAFENLLRFIATSDISFNAVDNNFLRETFFIFDESFILPGRDKLRNEMVNLSHKIHNEMLQELSGKTVSILFDGCHRWSNEYQGIILFTKARLYLYELKHTDDSKAKTIADVISSTVKSLKDKSIKVISACCDNCKANIKALNFDGNSAQEESESNFIRQPCSAHTANLAIKDLFSKKKQYYFVKKAIKILLAHLPRNSYRLGFSPKLKTIRWQSLYDSVCFITRNYELYQNSTNEQVIESLNEVQNEIGWNILQEVLGIILNFIHNVEKDLSSIDQIPPHYFEAYSKLLSMNNEISHDMANALHERFLNTCPLQLPLFAYFLTKDGLNYYREFCDGNQDFLDSSTNGMIIYQIERGFDDNKIEENINTFKQYLTDFDINTFSNFSNAQNMWDHYIHSDEDSEKIHLFATLASEVLEIPSSEAAVERLFAFLSDLTSGKKCNSQEQTLSARLTVKIDSTFKRAGQVEWTNLKHPIIALKLNNI